MNITEKILARASAKSKLEPGEIIFANIDKVMLHDVSGPGVIKVFEKLKKDGQVNGEKLFDYQSQNVPVFLWILSHKNVILDDKLEQIKKEPYKLHPDDIRYIIELANEHPRWGVEL